MRRRARHRLIGATVLIAAGVIGFPLLFDTEPRPVAVDIPIELPEKDQVPPLETPQQSVARAPAPEPAASAGTSVAAAASAAAPPVAAAANLPAPPPAKSAAPERKPDVVVTKTEAPRAEPAEKAATAERGSEKPAAEHPADKKDRKARDSAKAAEAVAAKPESRAPATPSRDELRIAKAEEAARARALLQGKSEKEAAAAAASVGRRYIVQVGAFSEAERARAARQKVERAGLKTFTQETKTGAETWIRVRVGPFATRAEADEAAARIKGSGLPASILTM